MPFAGLDNPWDADRPAIYAFVAALPPGTISYLELPQLPGDGVFPKREPSLRRTVMNILERAVPAQATKEQRVVRLVKAILKLLTAPDSRRLTDTYQVLVETDPYGHAGRLVDALRAYDLPVARLRELAIWLATESPDVGAVQYALALALLEIDVPRNVILTLGRFEYFTPHAAAVIVTHFPRETRDRALMEIAKGGTGWGRVKTIERMSGATDPEVRDWMLHEGFRNDISWEYSSQICATTGGLLAALDVPAPRDATIQAAAELLWGMSVPGPWPLLDTYPDGLPAMRRLLTLVEARMKAEDMLVRALQGIHAFLSARERDWRAFERVGWDEAVRAETCARIDAILADERWQDAVRSVAEFRSRPIG